MVFTRIALGVVNDYHCAVWEIGDALFRVTADADNFYIELIAWEILTTQPLSEIIDSNNVNVFRGGNFGEIIIIGHNDAVKLFSKLQ